MEGIEDEKKEDEGLEVAKIPTSMEQDVYPPARYLEEFSPVVIFIPKKEIMFKMMRACIGVRCTSDLWINRDDPNKIAQCVGGCKDKNHLS